MALSRALILVALSATIFSAMAVGAKEFVVGDDSGWTAWFDYQAWAANKVFRVGDILVFNYPSGKDDVIRVNGTDFMNCSVPPTAQVLTSGKDVIVLTSPGRRWYISGVGNHCQVGQKLVITVLPPEGAWSPVPSPLPSPAPAPRPPWTASAPHFGRSVPKKLTDQPHIGELVVTVAHQRESHSSERESV